MIAFERIKELAKNRKMTLVEVNDKAGLGTRTIYHWNKTQPGNDKLASVAKVLNTTTDYLNGLTDDPNPISSDKPSAIDLKEPHIFSYGGKPISDDDMEIIRSILERHRNENGN